MKDSSPAALRTILKAVRTNSANAFSFAGKLFALRATADEAASEQLTPAALIAQLSMVLYEHCYARTFTGQVADRSTLTLAAAADLLTELAAANTSRERLDAGWQILTTLDHGQIIAEKNGRTRLLQPGQFLTPEGAGLPPRVGQRASVFIPNGSAEQQPGFYFAFSEWPGDQLDDENIVRFYWHLQPEGAAPLIAVLTRVLNRWQLPFRFKTLRQRSAYQRADAAVLYINRRYYPSAALLLAEAYGEIAPHLRPETPLFTKRLADGLGLAEDPGNGESFGQHRCRLLAEGIWQAHERGLTRLPQRLAAVAEHFAAQGLNLATPYLNAHSPDIYEFAPLGGTGSGSDLAPANARVWEATRSLPLPIPPQSLAPEFVATTADLAAQICRDALWAGARCNWLGPSLEVVDGKWTTVHRAYGPDVYSGTSGIALFLGRLYTLTGERLLRVTAEGALTQCLSRLDDIAPPVRAGFYSGWSGIVYVLLQLAEAFAEPRYVDAAVRLLQRLQAEPLQADSLDVIAGSAGALQAALALHARQPHAQLLELADKHGRHLLATARQSAAGWSWRSSLMGDAPRDLTGYSHGTAGIGLALLELHYVTGAAEFRTAATEAFRYERHWFNPLQGNWPDFRPQTDATEWPSYPSAWCHGAPGIGLARLRAWELTGNESYRTEAETALGTTTKALEQALAGPLGDFSLCHGLTGQAELLLCAGQTLARPDCLELAVRLGKRGVMQFQQDRLPWPCGVPQAGEAPNLLLGLAGIGYFYLRLAEARRTPSILLL